MTPKFSFITIEETIIFRNPDMTNVVDFTKYKEEKEQIAEVLRNIEENLPILLAMAQSMYEDGILQQEEEDRMAGLLGAIDEDV